MEPPTFYRVLSVLQVLQEVLPWGQETGVVVRDLGHTRPSFHPPAGNGILPRVGPAIHPSASPSCAKVGSAGELGIRAQI